MALALDVTTVPDASLGSRAEQVERLQREQFDVLVVGGGITGAGVAWDAAARGLRVGLIEQGDFAGGTSSRSSKLVHGGLRYLAQGRLGLTREAVKERGRLLRLAPHLVDLLPFVFPIFNGPLEWIKLRAGLLLYDAFATGSGAPRHAWLGAGETLAVAPGLRRRGLSGAFVYRDARTDDARMVMESLRAGAADGAAVANYLAMRELLTAKGHIVGVAAEDAIDGRTMEIRARSVVLAAGAWLDRLVPAARRSVRVRPAKGVHVFMMPGRVPSDAALYLSTTGDGRLVFVIPWLGRTMIGTTDTAYAGDLAAPRATAEDVRYLLDAVNRAFPEARFTPADLISSQAGLRPLISEGDGGAGTTASLSREDKIFETEAGAIAIAGGKLTTFRRMAEKVVNLVLRRIGRPGEGGESPTAYLPLGGFPTPLDPGGFASWRAATVAGAPPEGRPPRTHLIARYGAHFRAVEALVAADARLGAPLVQGEPFLRAEALFAIRHEQAMTVSDVLTRRLRLTLLTRDLGRSAATTVADLLAREHGWDGARRERALSDYEADVAQYSVPR